MGKHYHNSLTDAEILFLEAGHDLKKEVTSDKAKSIQMCYNQAQTFWHFRTIPAKFKPFKTISNTLHKRRENKLPKIPSDYPQYA